MYAYNTILVPSSIQDIFLHLKHRLIRKRQLYNGKQQHTVLGMQSMQMQIITNATKCLGYRLGSMVTDGDVLCTGSHFRITVVIFSTLAMTIACLLLADKRFSWCCYFLALAITIACLLLADIILCKSKRERMDSIYRYLLFVANNKHD